MGKTRFLLSFLVSHQDLAKKPGFLSIFLGGVQPQNSDNNPIIIGATHHQTLPSGKNPVFIGLSDFSPRFG
ncbi:hypothetical protein B9S53_21915 [Arthrospira sp. O9.13F]|nr:hypothetical protein B9S53_21915 [Arthrospira sp. O9.13F]